MYKIMYVFFLSLLVLSGCSDKNKKSVKQHKLCYIYGELSEGNGRSIRIQKIEADRFIPVDSVITQQDGTFFFSIPIESSGFYALKNELNNYITLICHGNDSIQIIASYNDFRRYQLRGSAEINALSKLNERTRIFLDNIADFAKIVSDSVESTNYIQIKKEIDIKYRAGFDSLKTFSVQLIEKHPQKLVSLVALTNQLGRNFFVFHPVEDYATFKKVDDELMKVYPESDAVKKMHTQLEMLTLSKLGKNSSSMAGKNAPDFILDTQEKNTIQLKNYRGKVVLLNFWASWNKPDTTLTEEFNRLYRKYHSENFVLIHISLDKSEEEWIRGIKKMAMEGIHVSELNFWNSKTAAEYGVTSLPANFLINKKGTIIGENIASVELEKILLSLLNE